MERVTLVPSLRGGMGFSRMAGRLSPSLPCELRLAAECWVQAGGPGAGVGDR